MNYSERLLEVMDLFVQSMIDYNKSRKKRTYKNPMKAKDILLTIKLCKYRTGSK